MSQISKQIPFFQDSGKAHMTHSKLDKDPETSYVKKLEIVRSFLALNEPPHREEIEEVLGTAVSAHRSVPTALYCFLAAQKPIPEIEVGFWKILRRAK